MKLGWSVSWLVTQGWKWFGDFWFLFCFLWNQALHKHAQALGL